MMTKKKTEIDVRDQIMNHLKADDRNIGWLSDKTEIPYQTLYSILAKKERSLTEGKRYTINKALKTNY